MMNNPDNEELLEKADEVLSRFSEYELRRDKIVPRNTVEDAMLKQNAKKTSELMQSARSIAEIIVNYPQDTEQTMQEQKIDMVQLLSRLNKTLRLMTDELESVVTGVQDVDATENMRQQIQINASNLDTLLAHAAGNESRVRTENPYSAVELSKAQAAYTIAKLNESLQEIDYLMQNAPGSNSLKHMQKQVNLMSPHHLRRPNIADSLRLTAIDIPNLTVPAIRRRYAGIQKKLNQEQNVAFANDVDACVKLLAKTRDELVLEMYTAARRKTNQKIAQLKQNSKGMVMSLTFDPKLYATARVAANQKIMHDKLTLFNTEDFLKEFLCSRFISTVKQSDVQVLPYNSLASVLEGGAVNGGNPVHFHQSNINFFALNAFQQLCVNASKRLKKEETRLKYRIVNCLQAKNALNSLFHNKMGQVVNEVFKIMNIEPSKKLPELPTQAVESELYYVGNLILGLEIVKSGLLAASQNVALATTLKSKAVSAQTFVRNAAESLPFSTFSMKLVIAMYEKHVESASKHEEVLTLQKSSKWTKSWGGTTYYGYLTTEGVASRQDNNMELEATFLKMASTSKIATLSQ